jgi:diguanylate cyclase (GGDEF)-like protein
MLIDIDHFKSVNDNHGHAAGDLVVAEIARRISETVGVRNVCARWGGDEFIVLLNEGASPKLRKMVDAVMSEVVSRHIAIGEGTLIPITVSIGACVVEADEPLETATALADAALYMAKGEGRNRVAFFEPTATASERSVA